MRFTEIHNGTANVIPQNSLRVLLNTLLKIIIITRKSTNEKIIQHHYYVHLVDSVDLVHVDFSNDMFDVVRNFHENVLTDYECFFRY